MYKGDYEEERRDRERLLGLIDDMKKKKAQIEEHAAHERALYKQTLDEVQEDLQYTKGQLHKHKTLLADTEKFNQIKALQASKYKDEADAARGEASKYFTELVAFQESCRFYKSQAEANQRDVQAKASQVKQYAKEIERLKTKVSVWYIHILFDVSISYCIVVSSPDPTLKRRKGPGTYRVLWGYTGCSRSYNCHHFGVATHQQLSCTVIVGFI